MEFAVVAPLFFFFIFCLIEFSRFVFAVHVLEDAARTGCRTAILKGATQDQVVEQAGDILRSAGITSQAISISPGLDEAFQQGDLIRVEISANYKDISWLPTPKFVGKKKISAVCILPKEE